MLHLVGTIFRPSSEQQQAVLASRGVRVHPQEHEAIKLREGCKLTSCRVADGELRRVVGRKGKVAVAACLEHEAVIKAVGVVCKSSDGPELVDGDDPCPVVQGEEVQGRVVVAVEEGDGGLAGVVGEEEAAGGGGAAPRGADGAAAEDAFGRQADEDLPDGDVVREAWEERRSSCSCGLRHGRRRRALDPFREQSKEEWW